MMCWSVSLTVGVNIFKEHKDTGMKYKSRVRSRVSNLGDLKNPNLREQVICGNISPARIATMTTEVITNDIRAYYKQ